MAAVTSIPSSLGEGLAHRIAPSVRPSADVSREPPPAPRAPSAAPVSQDMEDARGQLQEALQRAGLDHRVGFRVDEGTGATVVEIRDLEGRLVRQFPPEKLLNLREKLADLSGMVVDRAT